MQRFCLFYKSNVQIYSVVMVQEMLLKSGPTAVRGRILP